MKLHVLSDLHTEFHDFEPPDTKADVIVLAGDIGVGADGVEWAAQKFGETPVVYVPGNHEYYDRDIGDTGRMRTAAAANIRVLANEAADIDGVRFLGATLWTDFALYGASNARSAREAARASMRDFKVIQNGDQLFTPEDSVALHEASRDWLTIELAESFDGPTVVVSHHLPALPSIAARYENNALNPAFGSRLELLIDKFQPSLWVHGHTHVACDYRISSTRVICNPRGYPGEGEDRGFDPACAVQV